MQNGKRDWSDRRQRLDQLEFKAKPVPIFIYSKTRRKPVVRILVHHLLRTELIQYSTAPAGPCKSRGPDNRPGI